MTKLFTRITVVILAILLLSVGLASAAPEFQLQSSKEIPVINGYVNQTFFMEDSPGKLVFTNLKLDPAYEGFLTLWTRGDARRIIVYMNKSAISIQADMGDMKTVLQERTGLAYAKTVEVQIAEDKAIIKLGTQTFTIKGVTAFAGKLDSIGISGSYAVYAAARE